MQKSARPYSVPVYRVALARDGEVIMDRPQVRSSRETAALFRQHLGQDTDREYFLVGLLDIKSRIIGINTVSMGSLSASVVSPRETFKAAILCNAASVILAHNHPSGDSQPSREDRTLTERLVQAGEILGIKVIDHIILGDGTEAYFSFADEGLLHQKGWAARAAP